ncbi:DUF4184 family protein [Massilia sp. IC2-476]|uniref:DUF4184 family protein n=1 Tax=Massilia sp. IC2-476 TaxID=2887199 RepID=UPI001D1105E4|nr:DUF4184 family protein [Massilia sp. IC2-476]MCC2972076.1 DUF4184 family protein [Massilia sp. IC2-476]
MPFTLCHPAAVLPLHAAAPRLTSLSALVVGSMAPDFVYFLPLVANGGFTHSAAGVLLYCVPAGLLVWLAYHLLLRDAFLAWAPARIAARMAPQNDWRPRAPRGAAIVLASLALGAATHVGWDAFTHTNTAVVRHVELLRTPVQLGSHAIPLFNLLQHLSSLVGALAIAAWFARIEPGALPPGRLSAVQRQAVLAAIGAATVAGAAAGYWVRPARSFEHGLFNTIVTAMAAAAATILLLSAARRMAVRAG